MITAVVEELVNLHYADIDLGVDVSLKNIFNCVTELLIGIVACV